ncbi:MAG: hypothetical protein GXO60_07140 [Epsilonproteobacteria bacterium]|nr:hypothetical protein [Campylobacterota bacterium]
MTKQLNGNNWFEMAKAYDLKEYLQNVYQMEFKANMTLCPFHADSKPTLSVKNNLFKCFACDTGGDITRFVELKEKMSSLEAVKKVLLDHGIDVGEGKELTPKQQEERNRIIAENNQKLQEDRKKRELELQKARQFARRNMNLIANKYTNDLSVALNENHQEVINAIESVFPKYFMADGFLSSIGWDWDNETVAVITRDQNGNVMNIKRRTITKNFSNWDVTKHLYEWKGDGKWIGWKNSTPYPFGWQFDNPSDDRVIITEGEKDCFNLNCLKVNALTLGGVASRWENFLDFLKNKKVYIWFDNDKAGYLNALKRYKEIAPVAKSCQIILFNKLEQHFPQKGDISDWLSIHNINSAEDIFDKIVYSSFVPHNELIKEIDDLYDDWKGERPIDFLEPTKKVKFIDIEDEIIKNAQTVRGEKDNVLKAFTHLANELSSSNHKAELERFITNLFNNQPNNLKKEVENISKLVKLKKTIINDYRQVHIYDIAREAKRATESCGYMFAKFRDGFYIWTGAYYYRFEDYELSDFILQRFFPAIKLDFKKQTVKTSSETVENIKGQAISLERWIDTNKRIITVNNGALIVNANGKHIFKYESNKKDCAFNIIDINYDPNATAPKWEAFLNRVLPDKEDQDALMEFIGYCILPSHRFEKFLLLYGQSGANGKSVVLSVISSFFGRENISGLNLHQMEGHELDALTNKILNVGSELEAGADLRKQLATLKALISPNDSITINPKHDKAYELYPEQKPKMAFATNKLPKSGINDGGVLRRMLLLNFNQEISDDEKIRDLTERFNDERAGILNLALVGLKRLIKNGKFSMSKSRAAFMEDYRDDIDPIRAYAKECIIEQRGVMVAKQYIYEHYKAWCEDKGHNSYTSRTFFNRLQIHIPNYSEKRTTLGKDELLPKNAWYVENVRLNSELISEFKFKKGIRETKHCMIDMKQGFQVVFE